MELAPHLIETSIMANMRYFPRRGTTREVGGMISTTSRKNTYKLVRIEMDNVTCKAGGRETINFRAGQQYISENQAKHLQICIKIRGLGCVTRAIRESLCANLSVRFWKTFLNLMMRI